MNKIIAMLCLICLTFSTFSQEAQHIRYGLKGGINFSHLQDKISAPAYFTPNIYSAKTWGPGYYVGGWVEIPLFKNQKTKLQVESLYNYNYFKYQIDISSSDDIERTLKMSSIQIPLSFKYYYIPRSCVLIGIIPSINVGGSARQNDYEIRLKEDSIYQYFMFGVHFGLDFQIKQKLSLNGRYTYFLTDAFDFKDDMIDYQFNVGTIQIGVSYRLN